MAAKATSSTVMAWELGLRLRQHRERLGLTAASVGKSTGIGGTNMSAIEAAKRRLTDTKLADLANLYELPTDERSELEALRTGADAHSWWDDYGNLFSEDFKRLIGLEAGASGLREYAPTIIPGLLQTPDYARAMIKAGSPYIKPVDVGPRLETRLARQDVFNREPSLSYSAIICEAALRQEVGGPDVMHRQLDHLVRVIESRRPLFGIRVITSQQGAYPLIGSQLRIMSFESACLPDLLWQETAVSGLLVDKRQVIIESAASYEATFELAKDEQESLAIIRQIRQEMEQR
ncbi:XRE family transcriptional regulator [Pseudonocardiaceae bacterium YIM PH 21723]|nr:XRE family transcriptional regulator [Pseudonocardiaceae bacterium YIM PH 21723]